MGLPKFSFSLPVYNEETRLERCLESILAQDYPKDNIEILVVDGGSTDRTKDIAGRFECVRLFDNHKKLADFGAKISAREANGDLFVIFAADNELADKDYLKTVAALFMKNPGLSALWGRMVASDDDAPLNKYYALIQNDPLSFFVNSNLRHYLKGAKREDTGIGGAYIFAVSADMPLIWGANGLVYRTEYVREIILQGGFIADNDVFQTMIESGHNIVAYLPQLRVYHRHVKRISDWVKKWQRNYIEHFLTKREERNLRWAFDKHFGAKLAFWLIYSGLPVFSIAHSIYLALRQRSVYWLYHPLMSFIQMITYLRLTIFTKDGRRFIKRLILK
ncbi:MAG: glycosyltransferase [Candidatus Omnitrophota bacterium]